MRAHSSRSVLLAAFALALGVAGCASSGGGGGSRPAGASSNRIVQAELEPLGQLDALQAVQRLRARWLTTRAGSGQDPVLYVDGTRRGAPDELRFIRADEVRQMDFMSGPDASTRFGTGHQGGAILVLSRR